MKPFPLLILLLFFSVAFSTNGFGLVTFDSTASATTDYIFGITLDGSASTVINIQSGATSSVALPSEYSGRMTNGAYTCVIAAWNTLAPETPPNPVCSMSGYTLTFTGLFTKDYSFNYPFEFAVQVSGILNPLSAASTGNFYFYLYATSGTIVITGSGLTISPATMTCSFTTSPNTTSNGNGNIVVSFLTPEFETTSIVIIDFNQYWP